MTLHLDHPKAPASQRSVHSAPSARTTSTIARTSSMTPRIGRTAATVVAGLAVAFSSTVVPAALTPSVLPAANAAINSSTPAGAAANFLLRDAATNLAGYGGTGVGIDAVISVAAAGGTTVDAKPLTDKVTQGIDTYITRGLGADAKALLYADVIGADPRAIDGQDLVQPLLDAQQPDGSFRNAQGATLGAGDHATAMIALHRVGALTPEATAAGMEFLRSQGCSGGGWSWEAPDADGECAFDTDITAVVAQALAEFGNADDKVKATAFLVGRVDGTTGGSKGYQDQVNSNTTAMSAMAFAALGDQANLQRNIEYLKSKQFGQGSNNALAGAVAFNEEGLGATAPNQTLRFSTAQAGGALAGATYVTVKLEYAEPSQDGSNNPAPAPGGNDTTNSPISGSSEVGKNFGIIALIIAILGALGAGFLAMNPQFLPRF